MSVAFTIPNPKQADLRERCHLKRFTQILYWQKYGVDFLVCCVPFHFVLCTSTAVLLTVRPRQSLDTVKNLIGTKMEEIVTR